MMGDDEDSDRCRLWRGGRWGILPLLPVLNISSELLELPVLLYACGERRPVEVMLVRIAE